MYLLLVFRDSAALEGVISYNELPISNVDVFFLFRDPNSFSRIVGGICPMSTFNHFPSPSSQIPDNRTVSPLVMQSAKNCVMTTVLDIDPASPSHREKIGWQWWGTSKLSSRSGLEKQLGGWKPITLRGPILGGLIIFSVLIISILEILASKSSGNANSGGLVFAADVDKIPTLSSFGWVDLDVKRLEPWFRLSTTEGAKAVDSLLLQYPSDFLPFVPVTALRRKHWSVFLAGTIMLIVFWAITPLQSAIFNAATITRSISTSMIDSAGLIPVEQQATSLNANFLNTAYAISWLGQIVPAFTTARYAILPFQPASTLQSPSSLETWTTEAVAAGTNLTCSPASVNLTKLGYTFSNGRGCSVSQINLPDTVGLGNYMVNYIGFYDNPQVDWSLQNPNCSAKFSNNFLALWASNSSRTAQGVYNNLTALFCETTYFTTRFPVTVNASNSAIVNESPPSNIGASSSHDRANITSFFNTSAFEYILSTGLTSTTQTIDLPSRTVLEQYPRLINYSLTWPVSNVVGFAVALNSLTVDDLSNPENLRSAFQTAHQLLFSTAFASLLDTTSANISSSNPREGLVQNTVGAIILVRPISIAVEVALGVVAIFTGILWYYSHRRSSHLRQDPASLAEFIAIYNSGRLSPSMFDLGEDSDKAALVKVVSDKVYHLLPTGTALVATSRAIPDGPDGDLRSSRPRTEDAVSLLPLELRWYIGVIFTLFILSSIFGVSFLNFQALKLNGLSLPSTNSLVLSILENYIPTIFATLLEPVWVLLNRQLCLLKPFVELRKGNARAATSLEAKYSSLPPQLAVWRAVNAGHYVLAIVCLIALSNNILAVSLSTLLNEQVAVVDYPTVAQQIYLPVFNDTRIRTDGIGGPAISYSDHFYMLLANLTSNTSLPAWVDHQYYYMPFTLSTPKSLFESVAPTVLQGFEAPTIGLGASAKCVDLSPGTGPNTYSFNITADGFTAYFSTTHQLPNGTTVSCVPLAVTDNLNKTVGFSGTFPAGKLALEVMQSMFPADGLDDGGFCASLLVAGWVRAAPTSGSSNSSHQTTLASSDFVACTSALRTAQFDAYVDASGHMISVNQTSAVATDTSSYFTGPGAEINLTTQAVNLIAPPASGLFQWHNATFTSDWMNSLLATVQNSDAIVDPTISPLDGTTLAPLIEDLYRQLFGLLITLNADHMFVRDGSNNMIPAKAIGDVPRLFLNAAMFQVSVAILILQFIVAVIYYVLRPKKFLPRMPTSVAAILSFVTASRALEDFQDHDQGIVGPTKDRDLRYAFGRYIGTDGKTHVGIEQHRFVVPLQSRNPAARDRKWRRILGNMDEKEPRTWI